MVLWSSSLFIWFRFQFGAWSCDRPLSSSGSGSSLVRGLVISKDVKLPNFWLKTKITLASKVGSTFEKNYIIFLYVN
jgi:hypothetical protein